MTGPPPKPYLIKKNEGNPGKRPLNPGPQFKKSEKPPRPPRWLVGEGRKLWRRLAPELHEQGLLTNAYVTAFEGLCANYGKAVDAERILLEHGSTFEVKKETGGKDAEGNKIYVTTYIAQRPEVAVSHKCWTAVRQYCQEFGITPSASGRIYVPKAKSRNLKDLLA